MVSALLSRGELMVLVSGRRLGRNGILTLLLLSSLWGMEGDFAFGRMLVVGKRPFQFIIPPWNLCFERPFNDWEMENVEN